MQLPDQTPPTSSARAAILLVTGLVVLSLGGCKLIDQRTFDKTVNRRPVPHAPPGRPAPPPPPPLATIQAAGDPGTWQPQLTGIVRSALSRKPLALFTVVAVVPQRGAPETQAAAMQAVVAGQARPVAEAIEAAGASTAQIEMTAMSDPSVTAPKVLVYVK